MESCAEKKHLLHSFASRNRETSYGQGVALSTRQIPDNFESLADCANNLYKPSCLTCNTIFTDGFVKQDALLGMNSAADMGKVLKKVVAMMKDTRIAMANRSHCKRLLLALLIMLGMAYISWCSTYMYFGLFSLSSSTGLCILVQVFPCPFYCLSYSYSVSKIKM